MIPNIWKNYGLTGNPFFSEALSGDSKLFVGRAKEIENFKSIAGTFDEFRLFVEGDTGSGKTSFVNHVKTKLLVPSGYFCVEKEIQINLSELNLKNFLFELTATLFDSIIYQIPEILDISEPLREMEPVFVGDKQSDLGGSISIAGVGGSLSKNTAIQNPEITTALLKNIYILWLMK